MSINWQGMLKKVSEQRDAAEREVAKHLKHINILEVADIEHQIAQLKLAARYVALQQKYDNLLTSGFDQMKRADNLQAEVERLETELEAADLDQRYDDYQSPFNCDCGHCG